MPEYITQKEAFLKCRKEGRFIVKEDIDFDKIKESETSYEIDSLQKRLDHLHKTLEIMSK